MKKDIEIPEVTDVHIAVVKEYNPDFRNDDWNVYIINKKEQDLEHIMIVSKGYNESKETTAFRHKLETLPAKSYAKIELMQEDVFQLNNAFKVSFFEGDKMFDKTYIFRKNTINEKALQSIPLMEVKGVLVK